MTTQRDYEILFSNYKQSRLKSIFVAEFANARKEIIADLEQLLSRGYNTYIIGIEDMYDILVAESLLEYRDTVCPQIHYYVIMHEGTYSYFNGGSAIPRIERVVRSADIVIETSKKTHRAIFSVPNQELVETLEMGVCYYSPYGDAGVLYCYKRDPFGENNQCIALHRFLSDYPQLE